VSYFYRQTEEHGKDLGEVKEDHKVLVVVVESCRQELGMVDVEEAHCRQSTKKLQALGVEDVDLKWPTSKAVGCERRSEVQA
jgi:hypothetical protein